MIWFRSVPLLGSFDELHAAGCIQTGADIPLTLVDAKIKMEPMYHALQVATGNVICDGCPAYNYGLCKAFRQYYSSQTIRREVGIEVERQATEAPGTAKYPGMSIKAIAAELGISMGEVRRRKMEGTI